MISLRLLKKIAAISLLSITMLAQTELHQVLKFRVFARHYAEHKQQNAGISVISFIMLHYFSGNIKDRDYEKDMQLPFKTADCANAASIAIAPQHYDSIAKPVFFIHSSYPASKNNFILSSHTSDIWQPPKFS